MITPFQKSGYSVPSVPSAAPVAGRLRIGSIVVAACLGLLVMGTARAVEIPALPVIQPEMAATHPELVQQREALLKERKALLDRTNSHNKACNAVEEGSAADARCTKAYSTLETAINNHVQASKEYNDNHLAAVNLAANQKPAPGADTSVVDTRNEPAGLGGRSEFKGAFTKPAPTLPSGDPSVVDARNVPSGLSKSVENAIATAYADAPPGVSDRVRKGFQAVADRDWKVAKAWFEDALNRDPGNANLKRFVALVDQTPEGKKRAISPRQGSVPPRQTFSSLNASAGKMSPEQVMKALEDIMAEKILEKTLGGKVGK